MGKTIDDEFRSYLKEAGNVHLAYYVRAANKLGIDYDIYIRSLAARFENDEGKHWFILNASVPINPSTSSALSRNKGHACTIFDKAGVPIAKQVELESEKEAVEFFKEYKNVVIKPVRNIAGIGVSILPQTEGDVSEAYRTAYEKCVGSSKYKVLGEEFISGTNYRLLVLGDKVIGAVRRKPAHVIGDGKKNIKQLVEEANKQRKKNMLKPIKVDEQTDIKLKTLGLTQDYIPDDKEEVILRFNSNLSTGGTTEECFDEIDEQYQEMAVKATKALGLQLGGVDLIAEDVSIPDKKAVINEVNTNPGLRVHYKVDKGEVVDVAIPIMEYISKNI
jgi:D-alanine-D-alanine ligase-like ATP-grasp enzyme